MRGMSVISSVFDLQDSSSSSNLEREREVRTLIWFLRERMDGVDRTRRRKSFKELIGFKGMGCCSATWGLRPSTISVRDDDDDAYVAGEEFPVQQIETPINVRRNPPENVSDPGCVGQIPAGSVSGMNLATALAVERQFRSTQDTDGLGIVGPTNTTTVGTAPGTPLRVSLMRLLEESDGGGETEKEKMAGEGNDLVCCVCMVRKKGSAFIPCGHTFCRVCSREMWLNRGSCPLCNRSILEILDIF